MTKQKTWSDVPTTTQKRIAGMGFVQFVLLVAALWDIHHRQQEQIKGSKKLWYMVSFINFAGPISYFVFGRKRAPTSCAKTEDESIDDKYS